MMNNGEIYGRSCQIMQAGNIQIFLGARRRKLDYFDRIRIFHAVLFLIIKILSI